MLATLESKLVAGIIGFCIIGLILLGAEQYGAHGQKIKDDLAMAQLRSAMQSAISNAQTENDALKTKLQEKKDEADKVVDFLANTHPAGGLQLPAHSCANKANPSPDSKPARNGTFPVDPQIAFSEFTKGLDKLAYEADSIVESCRVIKEWAQAQGSAK